MSAVITPTLAKPRSRHVRRMTSLCGRVPVGDTCPLAGDLQYLLFGRSDVVRAGGVRATAVIPSRTKVVLEELGGKLEVLAIRILGGNGKRPASQKGHELVLPFTPPANGRRRRAVAAVPLLP